MEDDDGAAGSREESARPRCEARARKRERETKRDARDLLAVDLARHGHNGDLAHGVVREQGILDLDRGDVLAAADDLWWEEEASERWKRREGEENVSGRASRARPCECAEGKETRTMSLARSEM